MLNFTKAQEPDFGQIITNEILEETSEREIQRREEVEGQPKEREQINSSHESYVRRRPVPKPRC